MTKSMNTPSLLEQFGIDAKSDVRKFLAGLRRDIAKSQHHRHGEKLGMKQTVLTRPLYDWLLAS